MSCNTFGNLTSVQQSSGQSRSFRYDSLSRMTRQKLAEREAKLDDQGQHVDVAGGTGVWSDVFGYDTRSNLTQRVDARGVKTRFNYDNDPLNRLQSIQYDKSGVPSSIAGDIPDAPNVSYDYKSGGDKTRPSNVYVDNGMGNQSFDYDSEGRLNSITQTFTGRESYPMEMNYLFDTLDRPMDVTYPQRWGITESRKVLHQNYDIASRVSSLTFDGTSFASNLVYNAASQVTSLSVGSQVTESYAFDPKTGLLTNQTVQKAGSSLLDLSYDYTQAATGAQKTGQLTRIIDNRNNDRNRSYAYDQLGRLKQAKGGVDGALWTQNYGYDRYGNRTSVSKSGNAADGSAIPSDGLPSVTYNAASNRITNSGFQYDFAGNQTQSTDAGGVIKQHRYDSAGRLAQVLNDSGGVLATYTYGASNQRLRVQEGGEDTYYAWNGGAIIAEYSAAGSDGLNWNRSYVYLGGRLLATNTSDGTQYQHPDRLGTRLITSASDGSVVSEQIGLPYGTSLPNSSSLGTGEGYQNSAQPNPHKRRFTSYDRSDVTGLDYAVNRHYNVQQGRFTQADPIGMGAASLGDPQSLNMYTYCGNDPINHIDPDGLFFGFLKKLFKWVLRIAAVIVAVGAVIALSLLGNPGAGITVGQVIGMFLGAASLGVAGWTDGKIGTIISLGLGAGAGFLLGVGNHRMIIQNFLPTGVESAGTGIVGYVLLGAFTFNAVANFLQENKRKANEQGDNSSETMKFLNQAIDSAIKALSGKNCRELIAGTKNKKPKRVLQDIRRSKGISLGKDSYTNTTGSGSKAKIQLNETIFNGNVSAKGINIAMGLPENTDRLTAASVEVLHELSHATGKFSHPGYNPGDEDIDPLKLNKKILETCFPGK